MTVFTDNSARFASTRADWAAAQRNSILAELDTALRTLRHDPRPGDPTPAQVLDHAAEKLALLDEVYGGAA